MTRTETRIVLSLLRRNLAVVHISYFMRFSKIRGKAARDAKVAELRENYAHLEIDDYDIRETLSKLNYLHNEDAGTWEDVRNDYFTYLGSI